MKSLWLALILTIHASHAQNTKASVPWWNSPIVKDLKLTDSQRDQIRSVVKEYRPRMVDARGAVDQVEGELEAIFNEDRVDSKRANEAITKLANARAELTRTISQMSLKLRALLTPQQWHELQRRRALEPPKPRRLREGVKPT